MEKKIIFELSGKELEAAEKFKKKQKKKLGANVGTIGDRWSYIFTPTGIGTIVTIVDGINNTEKDITDYSCW